MVSTWNGKQMLEAYLLLAICHLHALIVYQSGTKLPEIHNKLAVMST